MAALTDVLRMLDRLPLTDAERAEALRRLLAAPQLSTEPSRRASE